MDLSSLTQSQVTALAATGATLSYVVGYGLYLRNRERLDLPSIRDVPACVFEQHQIGDFYGELLTVNRPWTKSSKFLSGSVMISLDGKEYNGGWLSLIPRNYEGRDLYQALRPQLRKPGVFTGMMQKGSSTLLIGNFQFGDDQQKYAACTTPASSR